MSLVSTSRTDLTKEIGNGALGVEPWNAFFDAAEDVPELAWPLSVRVFNKMRRDSQIAALSTAFMLPIFGYRWCIDQNGASDEATEQVANNFNLPIEGQDPKPQGRRKDRFSFSDYLYHCLLKMHFGFMPFEQVYRFNETGKLDIRKLAPRMPGSIWQVQTEIDGGLAYIRQYPQGRTWDPTVPSGYFKGADIGVVGYSQGPIIPVDRLVMHVQDKEGSNWFGNSWLRSLWKEWLLKDRVLRVDAMKHERNGMGVPTIEAPPNATEAQMRELAALAQAYKSGAASGGALPNGAKLTLNGVQGALPDSLASIRYYDEQMARRFLAMFTTLGSTATGSRALGETFVDFFGMAQESMAKQIADITNEHVIEDLIDLNYSIDENAPLLKFEAESDRALATSDLVALIKVGALTADSGLEEWIRAEGDLPERDASDESEPPGPTPATEPATPPAPADRARSKIRMLNATAQRDKSDVEKQSKADFPAIKKAFDEALDTLVDRWTTEVRQPQIDELVATVAGIAYDDYDSLATVSVTSRGSDLLAQEAQALAAAAAELARAEVKAQGLELDEADLSAVNDLIADRAGATETVMARWLSQSAATAALRDAGGALTSTEIASNVGDHLNALTDAYPRLELGGALMMAQNSARMSVFEMVDSKDIYSSEIEDSNVCIPCSEIDGKQYESMDDARKDYPTAGYRACLGGDRCRGTVVITLRTESEPSAE